VVWNRSCRGGDGRLSNLGVPKSCLELCVRGEEPRSSRWEVSWKGRGTEVEWFGSDRERLGTERELSGTKVKWFGSGREVREDRG
jgi:hypothetical protein